jgi:lambda family phage portal protein
MSNIKTQNIKRMVVGESRRMFESASADRLTLSWDSNTYTPDQVTYSQLEMLRARSRQQARNNDFVVRLIQILQDNIVGASGFKLRSKINDYNSKPDKSARVAVEFAWNEFIENSDFIEVQQLIISSMVTDGEAFLFLRIDNKGQMYPTLIDPVRIDINFNQKRDNGNVIRMGIEYDQYLKPVAYHVNDEYREQHPGTGTPTGEFKRTRISAKQMLHIFRKQFVGQKRGTPWAAASLGRLFQLGRYEEAALTAARIGAAKMGFFRSESDEEYTGDGESGDMQINAEAGTFENIGSMEFQTFDPSYPSGEFKEFMTKTLQSIASGLGVDYHTLGNDLSGVNYSSARVGMLETREYFKTLQGWLIHSLMKPTYKLWLDASILSGRIAINQKPLNRGLVYYLPSQWVGRRWEWVDPQKEASGKQIQYEMRIISLSQIIRERGEEPEEVFKEIAEENALMQELGVTPAEVIKRLEANDAQKNDSE